MTGEFGATTPPRLHITVLTLFPRMLDGFLAEGMLRRAIGRGLVTISVRNLRDWSVDKRRSVDDRPFGGGAGMVMRCEPVFAAMEKLERNASTSALRIFPSPDGAPLSPTIARDLATYTHLIFLSGHYEGIDQRIRDTVIDREISVGDYVLSNGTIASAVIIDALIRFIPGVLGNAESVMEESFENGQLDFPQYTRPVDFRGMRVPDVLTSGDHAEIARWRRERQREKMERVRPDLLRG